MLRWIELIPIENEVLNELACGVAFFACPVAEVYRFDARTNSIAKQHSDELIAFVINLLNWNVLPKPVDVKNFHCSSCTLMSGSSLLLKNPCLTIVINAQFVLVLSCWPRAENKCSSRCINGNITAMKPCSGELRSASGNCNFEMLSLRLPKPAKSATKTKVWIQHLNRIMGINRPINHLQYCKLMLSVARICCR